jgi:hypothetical protein
MRWLPGSLATPTRQPGSGARLNTANPLTRGLRAAVVAVPGGLWDAVGCRLLRPAGSSIVAAPAGVALSTPVGGNTGVSLGRAIPLLGNALTVITLTTLRDARALGSGTGFLYDGSTSSGSGRFLIYRRGFGGTNTGTSYGLYAGGTAIQEGDTGLVGLLTTGARNVIAAVHNGNAHQIFKDGQLLQSWSVAVTYGAFTPTLLGNWSQATAEGYGGETELQLFFDRALSADEVRSVSANPWQLFEQPARPLWAPASTVTVYRPGSDVIVNGWTSTPSGSLASCIDDPTLDRADFITSPNLTDPATLAWASSLPAGSYSISVDADRLGASGQVRIVCLDSGGTSVGATSWQALTASANTYSLSVTTTGTSTQFRIEVQA